MFRMILTVLLCFTCVGVYAQPGPAPLESVIAEYDYDTGEIVVSYNGVNNWYVESVSSSLTGITPLNLPVMPGLVTDNDIRIGESAFGVTTYTDLNLGAVAATGLDIADMCVYWNAGLGSPTESGAVTYANVIPEPSTWILMGLALSCVMACRFGKVMHEDGRGLE